MFSLIFIVLSTLFISSLIFIASFCWFLNLFVLLFLILLGDCRGCIGFLLPVSRIPSSVAVFVVVVAFVGKGNPMSFCMHVCCAKLLQLSCAKLCLTVCDAVDCYPQGSSVHGILQASILGWVAMSSSRVSSQPWSWAGVSYISCIGKWILHHWAKQRSPCPFTPLSPDNFPFFVFCFVFLILGVLCCFGLVFDHFLFVFNWRF